MADKEVRLLKILHIITFILVIIGALNWGLVGAFRFNLVTAVLGSWPMIERFVYVLVGVSAIYLLVTHRMDCKTCSSAK